MLFAHKHLAKKMMFISLLDPFEINCLPFVFPLMISFFKDRFDISQIVAGIESWRMLQLLQLERDFVRWQDVMFNL